MSSNVIYETHALIDTSAIFALKDPRDQWHLNARDFFLEYTPKLKWFSLNITAHESFTRLRLSKTGIFSVADSLESFLLAGLHPFSRLDFTWEDELKASEILIKYGDHDISFHDALCASVMKRAGIYKIFTFDSHFEYMGFQLLPRRY